MNNCVAYRCFLAFALEYEKDDKPNLMSSFTFAKITRWWWVMQLRCSLLFFLTWEKSHTTINNCATYCHFLALAPKHEKNDEPNLSASFTLAKTTQRWQTLQLFVVVFSYLGKITTWRRMVTLFIVVSRCMLQNMKKMMTMRVLSSSSQLETIRQI